MQQNDIVDACTEWIRGHLQFHQDKSVNLFETTIRVMVLLVDWLVGVVWVCVCVHICVFSHLCVSLASFRSLVSDAQGGLLSSYALRKEPVYLKKAQELGERLMGAFTSGTPVPFSDVNLKTGEGLGELSPSLAHQW